MPTKKNSFDCSHWQYKFNSFREIALGRLDKQYPELDKLIDKAIKSKDEKKLIGFEGKYYYKLCSDLCKVLIDTKEKHNKKFDTDLSSIILLVKKNQKKIGL